MTRDRGCISLAALPWGACPECHQLPDRFFWVGVQEPPPFLAAMGLVPARNYVAYQNWQACSTCKTCENIGAGLLTPPPDLDFAQEAIELSAYTEVEFISDIGPPYQSYCGHHNDCSRELEGDTP